MTNEENVKLLSLIDKEILNIESRDDSFLITITGGTVLRFSGESIFNINGSSILFIDDDDGMMAD